MDLKNPTQREVRSSIDTSASIEKMPMVSKSNSLVNPKRRKKLTKNAKKKITLGITTQSLNIIARPLIMTNRARPFHQWMIFSQILD